jgi:protoporphyrinogen oxidase
MGKVMDNNRVVVIGAGISGISAGYHLKEKGYNATVYEKDEEWGGLCGNFTIDGFRFDKSVHLSFAASEYVQELFKKSTEINIHKPESYNYYEGAWVRHPAQNNLAPLPTEVKVAVIDDFIKNMHVEHNDIQNYEDWLRAQFGNYFAENFPMKYTRKYWTVEAKELSTTWCGVRWYKPSITEVLRGSYTNDTPNTYYAKEMRYPKYGGYKSFLSHMAKNCDIEVNKGVVKINPDAKEVTFADGTRESYDHLVSSAPLPELIGFLPAVPEEVQKASEKLFATSVAIVSLGFNKPDIPEHLWYYIYDEDFYPARCYSPSIKSLDNAPEGYSSVQFEIYSSEKKDLPMAVEDLTDDVIQKGVKMGLFKEEDIIVKDARLLPYGNVVFYKGMEEDREIVREYLATLNIHLVGRFGQWEYHWTDQSLLTGKDVVDEHF